MKATYFIFFLVLGFTSLNAQTQLLKGKVIDAETGKPVPYASVAILNQSKGLGASLEGTFQIPVSNGDTLSFSSIGYASSQFIIQFEVVTFDDQLTFELIPQAYELDSVQVIQLSDYFYLKRPILDTLDLGLREPSFIRDWDQIQTAPVNNGEAGIVISGFLNDFDKDLQQRVALKKIRQAEAFKKRRKAEREKHFNKALVKRVTRIDDRVIDEFMEFCNFLDGQILGKTEYEITLMILEKYKAFLRR